MNFQNPILWLVGSLAFIAVTIFVTQPSSQPAILLDKYEAEIKSLELQKQKLETTLASRRIVHKSTVSSAKPLPRDSSAFASSIDAYVTHLKHELEPAAKTSKHIVKQRAAKSHLDKKILTLRQEKEELEAELSTIVRHSANFPQTTLQENPESKQQLIAEKAALEHEISELAKDKDPVVRGVIAKYQTDAGGLLANVHESAENVLGSLGATISPEEKEKQLLMEAEAMGDVTPKEAFSQRVIALGRRFLRDKHSITPMQQSVAEEKQAHKPMIRRHGASKVVTVRKPINMVDKLKLELTQAERVAALQRKLEKAQQVLGQLED